MGTLPECPVPTIQKLDIVCVCPSMRYIELSIVLSIFCVCTALRTYSCLNQIFFGRSASPMTRQRHYVRLPRTKLLPKPACIPTSLSTFWEKCLCMKEIVLHRSFLRRFPPHGILLVNFTVKSKVKPPWRPPLSFPLLLALPLPLLLPANLERHRLLSLLTSRVTMVPSSP